MPIRTEARTGQNRLTLGLWGLAALLSAGVAIVSARYLPGVGSLMPRIPLSPEVLANLFAKPWLLLHVLGAVTALFVAPFQFQPGLRARAPGFHRWTGRVYAIGCLLGGAAGLMLALGSSAGPLATLGFGGLAIAWLVTTSLGWRTALQRRFDQHRAWMIRSFALTFAAVTLRLYLPLIPLTGVEFVDGYRAISFLCWVPNLVVAELYLRRTLPAVALFGRHRRMLMA